MRPLETLGKMEKRIGSMRVESVSVPVGDQDRAKQFYVGTLGFELLVDGTWREGMRWSEVAPEGSATSLMLVTWQAGMLPGMHRVIIMATDEIHTVHRELLARDVEFELPPTPTPRGTQAMFRDPFGNPLMLWEHAVARVRHLPPEESAQDWREGMGKLYS
jgi:catechol 2,3-dioxygenase-like lactoylglutathione lyase family enzyme